MLNLCTNVANLRRIILPFFGWYIENHRKGRRNLRIVVSIYSELTVYLEQGGEDSWELAVRAEHLFRDDDGQEE